MKKTLVAKTVAAVISGIAMVGSAQAVVAEAAGAVAYGGVIGGADVASTVDPATVLQVNTDGIGHILLVPYFSVQNGNDSYINIVNTDTRNAKAIKVRFRGASNSDDIFDFTVLMSPGDVFAMAVTKGADGLPKLVHNDKSCTLPANVKQSFVTSRLNAALTDAQKAVEASEGYVEILNMADIPRTIAYDATVPATATLYNMIKHVNGEPRNCAATAVTNLFNDPADLAAARTAGLEVPTTGLMANWTVINVPSAAAWTGAATAVEARVAAGGLPGYGNIVFHPQSAAAVNQAGARVRTADPLLRGGETTNEALETPLPRVLAAASYDFPDLSTPYLRGTFGLAAGAGPKAQAALLTQALAVTSVTNEYVTDPGLAAKTDWIFSMPTRRYNVARDYSWQNLAGETVGQTLFTNLSHDDLGVAIGGAVVDYFTNTNISTTAGQICVRGITTAAGATTPYLTNLRSGTTGDREERFVAASTEFVISPGQPAAPLTFCGEASVLSFNAAGQSSALGAAVARKDLTIAYTDGWVRIATPGLGATATTGAGLPIIGASVTSLVNGAVAPGVSGAFGQSFPHRATRY